MNDRSCFEWGSFAYEGLLVWCLCGAFVIQLFDLEYIENT